MHQGPAPSAFPDMVPVIVPLVRGAASSPQVVSAAARRVAQRLATSRPWRPPSGGLSSPGPRPAGLSPSGWESRLARGLLEVPIRAGAVAVPVAGETVSLGTAAAVGGVAAGAAALSFLLLSPLIAPDWLDWAAALVGGLLPGGWHGWGAQNGRARSVPTYGGEWGDWPTGTYDPNGPNAWTYLVSGTAVNWNTDCSTAPVSIQRTDVLPAGSVLWARRGLNAVNSSVGRFNGCGRQLDQNQIHIMSGPATGTGSTIIRFEGPTQWEVGSAAVAISVAPATPGVQGVPWQAVPSQPLPDFIPLPLPSDASLETPSPATPPFLSVLPLPVDVPVGDPVTEPEPATAPGPSPAVPVPGPGVLPAAPPQGLPSTPVLPTGLPAPAPAPAPAPTPAGQVTVGSPSRPITITPSPPPPTLPGIAQELGRLERKLDIMLGDPRDGVPDWGLDPQAVIDAVKDLLQSLPETLTGTTYLLDSPCNKDEEGERLEPVEVVVPDAEGLAPALISRLDAIAELLYQGHNMPAPTCKHARPAGQAVTVRFQEV